MRSLIIVIIAALAFCTTSYAKTVVLSWDASPSVIAGYKVYYHDATSILPFDGTGATEGASPVTVGNVLTFTITGLPDNQTHYFAVTAYDAAGYESSYSNIVTSFAVGESSGKLHVGGVGKIQSGGAGRIKFQ